MEESFVSNPYKKEEKKTFAEVVIAQIDACAKEFSKEMKAGFQYEQVIDGQRIVTISPDQRLLTINHVKTLYDLLLFYFDDEIKEELQKLQKKMKDEQKDNLQKYMKAGDKPQNTQQALATGLYPRSEIGNFFKEQSMFLKVEHYRKMFQLLVLLYKRKHELSGKRTIGYDTK